MNADSLEAERTSVAQACRQLAAQGLVVGSAGNVSVRVGELVAVTATGIELATAEPEQVTVVTLDGSVAAGTLAPTSELFLHLGVYRRHDAAAVVHTHSPEATAVSLVLDLLPCVHYQQLLLGGDVPVVPFAPFGSTELADSVVDALDGKRAVLMANHGAVTIGAGLSEAASHTVLLEWACALYRRAAQLGVPKELTAAQQQSVIEAAIAQQYGRPKLLNE